MGVVFQWASGRGVKRDQKAGLLLSQPSEIALAKKFKALVRKALCLLSVFITNDISSPLCENTNGERSIRQRKKCLKLVKMFYRKKK
jgi:hypothetical protein